MAEGGQTDDNIMRPDGSVAPKIDRRPEWRMERGRMIRHICNTMMENMSQSEKESRARASINDSIFYLPDAELISKYEKCDGKWTEIMVEKYRHKEDTTEYFEVPNREGEVDPWVKQKTPSSVPETDKIEEPPHRGEAPEKEIALADVGISEEARLRKEEKRRNMYGDLI